MIAGTDILTAMTKMNMLMTQPVTGSRMTNLFPRNMAPPMPISDPIEDIASERWCQALAIIIGLLRAFPWMIV